MFRRKKKRSLPEGAIPAIRKSICTGEETFGYIDATNRFISLCLIKNRNEIYSEYDVEKDKVKEIYETRYNLESSSKTTLSLALVQYVNGAIGYMDLLDAQRTYLDAQISLNNALLQSRLAKVNLYKALGGGWK